tara:strand:- start:4093 stop:4518 length:426 start_codon:yes stop_codon:yes gene_type:complete
MFDGTDLSLVYGDSMLEPPQVQSNQYQQPVNLQNNIKQAQTPPDVEYQAPEAMYTQQHPESKKVTYMEPSFWDKLGMKRGDVFKLVIFALIILLAISMDKLLYHYLKNYIDENILTWSNEFIIRLSYPVLILILIWISKAI